MTAFRFARHKSAPPGSIFARKRLSPTTHSPGIPAGVTDPPSVSAWAETILGFHPDPIQTEILDCREPDGLLLCSRQFGKTTITAIKAAHHALFRPEAKVVVGSRSQRQSEMLVAKAAAFLRHAGAALKPAGLKTFGYALPNGARLYALPHKPETTRGFDAVTLLIFDEAAVVSDELYEMATAFQAAASDPSLWLRSSAGPQSGFFYEEWSDPRRSHWRRFKATVDHSRESLRTSSPASVSAKAKPSSAANTTANSWRTAIRSSPANSWNPPTRMTTSPGTEANPCGSASPQAAA